MYFIKMSGPELFLSLSCSLFSKKRTRQPALGKAPEIEVHICYVGLSIYKIETNIHTNALSFKAAIQTPSKLFVFFVSKHQMHGPELALSHSTSYFPTSYFPIVKQSLMYVNWGFILVFRC